MSYCTNLNILDGGHFSEIYFTFHLYVYDLLWQDGQVKMFEIFCLVHDPYKLRSRVGCVGKLKCWARDQKSAAYKLPTSVWTRQRCGCTPRRFIRRLQGNVRGCWWHWREEGAFCHEHGLTSLRLRKRKKDDVYRSQKWE